jgi:hypothetical protein
VIESLNQNLKTIQKKGRAYQKSEAGTPQARFYLFYF